MAQQTAVEWLEERLNVYFKSKNDDSLWKIKSKFLQATAMEKEQIMNAYNKGNMESEIANIHAEKFYKETYNK